LLAGNAAGVPFVGRANFVDALAFDPKGDLWATEGSTINSIGTAYDLVEFNAASLAAATAQAPPAPALTIVLSAVPQGLTFDANGNLWVAVGGNIDEYAGAPASASTLPIVQIAGAGFGTGLAFAPDGTLWYSRGGTTVESVTNTFGPNYVDPLYMVYGLTPSQIVQSGSPAPTYALSVPGPFAALAGQTNTNVATNFWPNAIAFDASGNLWAQSEQNSPGSLGCPIAGVDGFTETELFEFTALALRTSSTYRSWPSCPTSAPGGGPAGSVITTNTASASGMLFDASGNLYEATAAGSPGRLTIYQPSAFANASPQPLQSLPFPVSYIAAGPTYR
jgi:hypothetical protein